MRLQLDEAEVQATIDRLHDVVHRRVVGLHRRQRRHLVQPQHRIGTDLGTARLAVGAAGGGLVEQALLPHVEAGGAQVGGNGGRQRVRDHHPALAGEGVDDVVEVELQLGHGRKRSQG
ncbi:hypothetical protein D3C72_1863100 [compost metagenome]